MTDGLDRFRQTEYVAVGYVSDAKSYLRAATLLGERDDSVLLFSPTYFLLCHAIELLLKAFTLATGRTERDLQSRDVRHQLKTLLNMAIEAGLSVDEHGVAVIDMLAPYHEIHSFRYHDTGFKQFPVVADVLAAREKLQAAIEPVVVKNLLVKNPAS